MLNHHTSIFVLAAAVTLGTVVQLSPAAVLSDNFDDGTLAGFPSPNVGGATLTNPGSGGNPNGYLRASRDSGNPGIWLNNSKYSGDWEAMIGSNGIIVSVDIKVEDLGNIETLRFEISNPTFSDIWRKDIFSGGPPFPIIESSDGWVTMTYAIDTDWTDTDANAAGWNRVFPSGSPQSFTQVIHNVQGALTGFTFAGNSFVGGGLTKQVAFDNFSIAPAVPEPATMGLVVAGLLLARRKSC